MAAGSYFLDTNVLVYANDRTEAAKQSAAIRLITDGIQSGRAVISAQVLGEFWVTVTQKIQVPLDRRTAEREVEHLRGMRVVSVEYDTVRTAAGATPGLVLGCPDTGCRFAGRVRACVLGGSQLGAALWKIGGSQPVCRSRQQFRRTR